ncbi:hypothetical protein B0T17DRAFT_546594 [Bombardia bombarda]|uniref:Uncharacterized protein n=1 Tax=Bombardia bombarda TaxID=252184 RepID=A0AA39TLK6_9PEZI|nr:hypothetical protein B0T17DRAFT_546594 [Bombardia bombarda]
MEVALVKHIAALAGSLPGGKPARRVWELLRDSVVNGEMNDHLALQCSRVAIEVCRRYLGPYHGKTLELMILGYLNFGGDVEKGENMMREMMEGLDALQVFDERHAGVRMNMAVFYNSHGMYDKGAEVVLEVVGNEWMLRESMRYHGVLYRLYWELANSRHKQGRLVEAEKSYRDALEVAKWEISEERGGRAEVLDGLVHLERCLRDMGEEREAENVKEEREMWIKDGLERAGEIEEVSVVF